MQIMEERECKLRSANDWMREAKKRPIPRALFGEFWREGEMAVLFGDTGKGKSALAMQIAESIAAGRGFGPFAMKVEAQPVLYLDLEMSDKQFETRYAADHDGGDARFLHKHHTFPAGLIREEFDPAECWIESGVRPADVFYRELRRRVVQSKAKAVIIDSLTCLKRSYYGTRETLEMLLVLKRLRKELGLSILVLIQTPKQKDSQPITADLTSLRMLSTRADSVFGIGQSRSGPDWRYLKRVRSVSDAIHFDGLHVPEFRLKKIDGNFLGFDFERFAPEIELISDLYSHEQWETINKIKELTDKGKSIREIAAEIGLPKTTVHRLLQMWRPPVREAARQAMAPETAPTYYFPGREEFEAATADPKFKKMFETGDEEDVSLQKEYGIIERACARARKDYEEYGTFTPLANNPEYNEFRIYGIAGRPDGNPMSTVPETSASTATHIPPRSQDEEHPSNEPFDPFAHLKYSIDANGRDIFVEKENAHGKPVVWYIRRRDGRFSSMVSDRAGGNFGLTVDGPVCRVDFRS